MQFLRESEEKAVQAIAKQLCDGLLAGKRVLWFVSGGSNVTPEVAVMKLLHRQCGDKLAGLAILPLDERYGKPGHKDSNVELLRSAGFEPGEATLVDMLTHNLPFDQTLDFYTEITSTALASAGLIIGQFGLGADGHTAGILPDSPATKVDEATVAAYEWHDYTRLTLTPMAIKQIQVGYVLAYGEGKLEALERLRRNNELLAHMPAKILYEIPNVYIYNDSIETSTKKENR